MTMITKKQQTAAAVLGGCLAGMAIVGAILAAGWVMIRFPYEFWMCVAGACVLALVYFGALAVHDLLFWIRYRPFTRRATTWVCMDCAFSSGDEGAYLRHRCPGRGRRNGGVA